MYRIGHGDCFLLAFPGKTKTKPVHVLIDCGFKPGSQKTIDTNADAVVADIREATGGYIDVAVITHEHQDHVNAITAKRFEGITIGKTWFAWTEDPDDELANRLRKKHHDRLVALDKACERLSALANDGGVREQIHELMRFELGGDSHALDVNQALAAAGKDGSGSLNKKSMNVFKNLQKDGIRYLRPHKEILELPGAKGVRVFVLGPPRDEAALTDLDPKGDEKFGGNAPAFTRSDSYFAAALGDTSTIDASQPFSQRHRTSLAKALSPEAQSEEKAFLANYYGTAGSPMVAHEYTTQVATNAGFRRIDHDWLFSAGQMALDMNDDTNNSSLVLAFELEKSKKVLLFAGDAQRGNRRSWTQRTWRDGTKRISTRDLLSRTVLYKVGHHCSHNATLNGKPSDNYPNLSWMAEGAHASEFTAMITAVRAWAVKQNGWDHPKKEIKEALMRKAGGRVFQTDTDLDKMEKQKPEGVSKTSWAAFLGRTKVTKLYFDLRIEA
jgi:beta-lactamase superfamily II metal-dependent hydrolase